MSDVMNDNPANWCPGGTMMTDEDFGNPGFINVNCLAKGTCGNKAVEAYEQCDDGNKVNGDGCDSYCQNEGAVCGNGKLEFGEECDDGNTVAGDGCSPICKTEYKCGNGKLETPYEECDDGNTVGGDGCSATCKNEPKCGNGKKEAGEECDDGNVFSGDGCSAECKSEVPVCGNNKTEAGEECDDGNLVPCDGCSELCKFESNVCGNGEVEVCNDEECDDGNTTPGDGCDQWCKKEGSTCCEPSPCCCDGKNDPGEDCDDGNKVNGDGCSSTCKFEVQVTGIAGAVTYNKAVTANDALCVLAWDTAQTDPIKPTAQATGGTSVKAPAFPGTVSYTIDNLTKAGTYYVAAVIDVAGTCAGGLTQGQDFGNFAASPVVVTLGKITQGVNITITATPVQGGTVTGTVTSSFAGGANDSFIVMVKTSVSQGAPVASTQKYKPPPAFPFNYTVAGVQPTGQYYVMAILDVGDNMGQNPPASGDYRGVYKTFANQTKVTVTVGQTTSGINFALEKVP
jgi:cysteine-rich repeat protein